MKDVSVIELISDINDKLDNIRKESKEDMLNLKNELKIDINKTDAKLDKISENMAAININLAEIVAVNSKESIDKKTKSDRKYNTKITFISIVVVSVIVLIIDKVYTFFTIKP